MTSIIDTPRDKLIDRIADHLTGQDADRITRLDHEPLTQQPGFWGSIKELGNTLSSAINQRNPLWTAWWVADEALRLHILNGRHGDVIAYGTKGNDEYTAYLILTPDALHYHRPLTTAEIRVVTQEHEALYAAFGRAMDEERALLLHTLKHFADLTGIHELDDQGKQGLQLIAYTLWKMDVLLLSPTERGAMVANMIGMLEAVIRPHRLEIEEVMAEARIDLTKAD